MSSFKRRQVRAEVKQAFEIAKEGASLSGAPLKAASDRRAIRKQALKKLSRKG